MFALVSAIGAMLAAWVSFGTIGFDTPQGARIALLPVDALHVSLAASIGLLVAVIGWTRARGAQVALAVSPVVLVLLPWLPFRVPAAFLIWTGAMTSLVWVAVAAGLLALTSSDWRWTLGATPRTQARLAALLSAIAFAAAAWGVSGSIPGGDEPHYLVITQSLLYDHDLKIENNHARGDYRSYFAGELRPDFTRRGRAGEIYSIHAPGLPALVLPAFAIGGYHAVVVFLILCSAAACGLAWWLAWRVSGSISGAWFGWAAVALSPPFLVESFTVYPDGLGAAIVLTGVWALLRAEWERDQQTARVWPWLLHGATLALLSWMHTRFAVLAATIGGLVLVRLAKSANPLGKAIAFLSAPAVSALAWLFFFVVIYGTPDPSAPYGGRVDNSFAFFPNGAGGLLFDQGAGLLATAPVLVVAFAGWARARRLAIDWVVIAVPYFLAVATFAMWWAGVAGPARFLVPLVLPLAISAACAWKGARSIAARVLMVAALVVTCWLSAVVVFGGGGRLAYHTRNDAGATPAPWFEWSTHAADLPSALPAFVPLPAPPDPVVSRMNAARGGFAFTAIWVLCLGTAAWIVWRLSRPSDRIWQVSSWLAMELGVAAMVAASLVWSFRPPRSETVAAAQLDVLRAAAIGHALAVDLTHRSRVSVDDLTARVRIEIPIVHDARGGFPDRRAPRLAGRDLNRPLATLPGVPAGEYELRVRRHGAADGWVMAGISADQFSLVTQPIAAYDAGVRLRLPLDVRALVIRADEAGREEIDAVDLHALRVFSGDAKVSTETARRAIRYGDIAVFFVDDHAFGEPSAFWIAGGRESHLVIAPPSRLSAVTMTIRNAPVANHVTLQSAAWRQDWSMQPGEERTVDVPIDARRGAALLAIRSDGGFRPSEADPRNRDSRYLGVYVKIDGGR